MTVEFIINKNTFKKLLKDELFTAKNGMKVVHSIAKVKGKENYLLILVCESSPVASAEALSELRIKLENIFKENGIKYRLLTEGASQFFVNKLYPLACEFEAKLRKFIYISLIDIDDKAENEVVNKFKKTLLKSGEDKNFDKLPQDDFLAKKDFGQIFDFLFSNDEFLAQAKKINESPAEYNRRLTKKGLLKKISELPEQTVWNLLFAPSFGDSKLPEIYNDRLCRC